MIHTYIYIYVEYQGFGSSLFGERPRALLRTPSAERKAHLASPYLRRLRGTGGDVVCAPERGNKSGLHAARAFQALSERLLTWQRITLGRSTVS